MPARTRKPQDPWHGRLAAWLGEVFFRAGSTSVRALPLLVILAGVYVGGVAMWRAAMQDPTFTVGGDTLSLSGAFCPEAEAELRRLGRMVKGRSLLDPDLLEDLRCDYESSPWVKRVCLMRRVFPNQLAIEFVLRSPVAQIRQSRYYWMVDSDCVLLKVSGKRHPVPDLPVVIGIPDQAIAERPTAPGEAWRDAGVRDALNVMKLLRASPLSEDLHVRKIMVHGGSFLDGLRRQMRKRPRLDLEMQEGLTVRWGTYNAGEYPEEMLSAEKLSMLRNLVARDFSRVPGVMLDVATRVPGFSLPPEY